MVAIESLVVSTIASAIVSVIVAFIATEYRLRRTQSVEESADIEEWYIEAAQLASRLQRSWRQKFENPVQEGNFGGYDEIKSEMNLMSGQLNRHASKAQGVDVDENVIALLDETANICQHISQLHIHLNVLPEFREEGNKLVDKAEELEQKALKNTP
jgi:hypothetical protein